MTPRADPADHGAGEPPAADPDHGDRFRAEEERAVTSLAGWIGHGAIPGIIQEASPLAAAAVAPVSRHLVNQREVIWFCWHVFEMSPVRPGWARPGHIWWLTPLERAAIEPVKDAFRTIVVTTADTLTAAGVPLIPSWAGDLAVVAELLLLLATGFQIPWAFKPLGLAGILQPPANSAIEADASGTKVRRGTSERAERNATALRRAYEAHLHGPRPRAPYARGGTRAVPQPTQQRRDALRAVLEVFPDATAASVHATYAHPAFTSKGKPATPGGYLRHLLKNEVPCPARSTLAADFTELRADRPAKDGEKLSS